MEKPLIDNRYKLERFPGKGGWTYVAVPDLPDCENKPTGWAKVRGTIDECEVQCRMMPMGNHTMMLPVKAEIRKNIGNKEGDWVTIKLFSDDTTISIPDELLLCLADEPKAHETFLKFSESEQSYYIKWIIAAKREETKIERLAQTVNRVLNGQKFYDKTK